MYTHAHTRTHAHTHTHTHAYTHTHMPASESPPAMQNLHHAAFNGIMPAHSTAIKVLAELGLPPSCRGSSASGSSASDSQRPGSEKPCLVLSLFDQPRAHHVLAAGQELAQVAFGQPILEGKDGIRMRPALQQLDAVAVGFLASGWALSPHEVPTLSV